MNSYTQCFGNEAAVFIRGHATAQLNVRENVPRDVALQNLKFCPYGQIIHPSYFSAVILPLFLRIRALISHHALEKVAGLCHWANR